MAGLPFPGLRARLVLLVLVAVLPALGLALHAGIEERRAGRSGPGRHPSARAPRLRQPRAPGGADRAVPGHAHLALSNLRLQESLRDQAIRDPLTGLFNRRYMEESLDRELRRARRRQVPLSVIMIDIDHFKRFNDTFGHAAGDALLREIGALLQRHTRAEDIACRYGGEEFALILLEASAEDTEQRAALLRQEAARMNVEYGHQPLGNITISVGVAVFPDHGGAADALLKAADAALYRAKAKGRDRVMIAATVS